MPRPGLILGRHPSGNQCRIFAAKKLRVTVALNDGQTHKMRHYKPPEIKSRPPASAPTAHSHRTRIDTGSLSVSLTWQRRLEGHGRQRRTPACQPNRRARPYACTRPCRAHDGELARSSPLHALVVTQQVADRTSTRLADVVNVYSSCVLVPAARY